MKKETLLCVAGGLAVGLLVVAATRPAAAQAADAAERCTPDVMRLCSEFTPDEDRIVACLKARRDRLSSTCLRALTSGSGYQRANRR
jgi:hypothetical protein